MEAVKTHNLGQICHTLYEEIGGIGGLCDRRKVSCRSPRGLSRLIVDLGSTGQGACLSLRGIRIQMLRKPLRYSKTGEQLMVIR